MGRGGAGRKETGGKREKREQILLISEAFACHLSTLKDLPLPARLNVLLLLGASFKFHLCEDFSDPSRQSYSLPLCSQTTLYTSLLLAHCIEVVGLQVCLPSQTVNFSSAGAMGESSPSPSAWLQACADGMLGEAVDKSRSHREMH